MDILGILVFFLVYFLELEIIHFAQYCFGLEEGFEHGTDSSRQ